MPLNDVRTRAARAIAQALEEAFDHLPATVELEVAPRRELGDLAWPGALPLAKVLRRPPRQIAEAVAEHARWPAEVRLVEVAGPGFLNLWLDRGRVLARLVAGEAEAGGGVGVKTVVEHTNINPNKAAHIGHLRNAVLGDVLVRCLRHLGHEVETQNYIDDTGVQVADVVVGLLHLPESEVADALGLEPVRRDELVEQVLALDGGGIAEASTADFDDACWAIYPRVTARYESDEAFKAHRTEVLHAVEAGHGGLELDQALQLLRAAVVGGEHCPRRVVARLAAAVADANLRCHLATMARLGIGYDLLPHESDILHLGFWQRAFELLRESGAVRLEETGKNAGCWVMSLASSPEFADMDDPDKILVRSNGTVTYTGKDIAYQLWKLGLLVDPGGSRHDFGYRAYASWSQESPAAPVAYGEGDRTLVETTSSVGERVEDRSFGAADRVYNVIDVRQSYPQKVVKEAVRVLGHPEAADSSVHFAYEMVALTPAAVKVIEERGETSFGLSDEEMAKAFIEMSGRRGIGVRADEFLDVLTGAAEDAIVGRLEADGEPADVAERARAIAVGALRYLMARQSRNRVLAFDFDEALAFEGDTGPYLQYSAVRAGKIFSKLAERRGEGPFSADELGALEGVEIPDDLWSLVFECARRREVVAQAVAGLEFSLLAQHVHGLAQLFHRLYHSNPVVPEEDATVRALRRAVFTVFVGEMRVLLEMLLGIPIPAEL
ncbi:MAG TPA: arginine--tRNA ligase [Candidatus Sulfomarinibacteraceae bacterium]|nr:arginine--tRNA ligase [Candidatus Sulfomarinibacteraceae bacterium]